MADLVVAAPRKRAREERTFKSFKCKGCKRDTPPSKGCDDDMPNHCDDCWLAAHPEHQRQAT